MRINMNRDFIIKEIYNLSSDLKRKIFLADLKQININNKILKDYNISLAEFKFEQYLYKNNPKKCSFCNKIILYEKRRNKFCSSSCSAKLNNKEYVKRKSKYSKSYCVWCFKDLGKTNKLCCNKKCYEKYFFMINFLEWYNNSNNSCNFNPPKIKKFIEVIKGYKCIECGCFEHDGEKITLHLEHIDGNHKNNSPDNVCLLCPNCHSQTNTYKGKNKGNGRSWRMIRYYENKSY